MPLFLYILAYFPRYGHFMDSTLLLQQKSILQYIFPNFDRGREFCKKLLYGCMSSEEERCMQDVHTGHSSAVLCLGD